MKILITGGSGFQGGHLVELLLNNGHTISVLNTYLSTAISSFSPQILGKINLIWGSITDKELVDKSIRGQDAVFHLAARINVDESLKDPLAFLNVNTLGTFNVLEAVRSSKARLILASTCEVYGDGHNLKEGQTLNEHAELMPNSPYAASKAAADRLAYAYFKSFGVNVVIVRPFNVYGERQKSGIFGALIPILVAKALRGENLTVFGNGSSTRDYSHVSDIVGGYNIALSNPSLSGKVINLASGHNTAIKDIAEYIAKKFNVKVIHGAPRPGEVSRFPADISFARSLGYEPKIGIWEGIDKYITWVRNNEH